MAAVGTALPARRLAARDPLARHPPAPDLFRLRRVLEVEDHHDVAAIAVEIGGEIRVASVEGEAMEALPLDEGERAWARGLTHAPHTEAPTKVGRDRSAGRPFAADQQHATHRTHLPQRTADWHR